MDGRIVVLILCGGSGSRLWPLSHKGLPKQFAQILPGNTLFERTVQRNRNIADSIIIALNESQTALADAQMQKLSVQEYFSLVEPVARNTTAPLALASMLVNPQDIIVTVASDHIITHESAYSQCLHTAIQCAQKGSIVTFGILPQSPETGYGYIEADKAEHDPESPALRVQSFREKPDAQTAQAYLDSGNYYWNSGMFCFKASVFLAELEKHNSAMLHACREAFNSVLRHQNKKTWKPLSQAMAKIPAVSVDYALMEKTKNLVVIPCDIGWSDLGSFESLWEYYNSILREPPQNELMHIQKSAENTIHNCKTEPVAIRSKNNLILSTNSHKQIALIDMEGTIVVETSDSILICKKESGQKVKEACDIIENRIKSS